MSKLFRWLLLSASAALLTANLAHAKEEAKSSAAKPAASGAAASTNADQAGQKSTAKATESKDAKSEPMDINTASEEELASLPKIGEARAKAIVKGRPYRAKNELVQKKVISQDAYDSIKDLIVAKHSDAKKGEQKASDTQHGDSAGKKK